ncbi:MAG: NAD(+) synthase [Lachnospiraceae bacterium]|nr:NAD(+) synthase [Lachnospiraceae bacterium]MDD7223400.1 NAD(+) synthase [Lachnospiraceae bacterium]MDY3253826.1 NAD(+) synthase [Lachnospiraceae bacterium]MDY4427881.1 NAD(+) synthase [Lachnospiraceae bacterium]
MKDGFVKVCCATPKIKVADVDHNVNEIIKLMYDASENGAKVIVFPELCITGYTCQDLFLQGKLLDKALEGLDRIIDATNGIDALVFVGTPLEVDGKLYNTAAAIFAGHILAFIPKKNLPNYAEYYEARHFYPGFSDPVCIGYKGQDVVIGQNVIFTTPAVKGLQIACEICEDLWVADTPSTRHAMNGANLIVNLSAGNEIIGKAEYRRMLVKATSARLVCGYVYCDAGDGESTQDLVFPGHNLIAENGTLLSESKCFKANTIYADIDVERLRTERRRITTFNVNDPSQVIDNNNYAKITFDIEQKETRLDRQFYRFPFVPADDKERNERCEHILSIQSEGLKKRLLHTGAKKAVIGLSGGLDSTLALLVMAKAFDLCGLDRSGIIAVTMPCFGTTDRTYNNALTLAKTLNTTLREINIEKAVRVHFEDIGHDENDLSVTYENCQARERTQVLMDIANKEGGLVIGTGDMSELALGWATYNGDHMSMYGVNAGVPKTLVRHLVKYYADTCKNNALSEALLDVLNTPVSPELLPPKDGDISQKTEDLVGPYELHDFFLYYMLRCGFAPSKVYRVAKQAFEGVYDEETILKWLKTFYRRFFTQQFKRSCLPDGPKVGAVALSPRGDLRMPSDAVSKLWLDELEALK